MCLKRLNTSDLPRCKPFICGGCFACQSPCSVISLDSARPGQLVYIYMHMHEPSKVDVEQ